MWDTIEGNGVGAHRQAAGLVSWESKHEAREKAQGFKGGRGEIKRETKIKGQRLLVLGDSKKRKDKKKQKLEAQISEAPQKVPYSQCQRWEHILTFCSQETSTASLHSPLLV